MSKVQIADVIEPSRFMEYVIERTTAKSALVQSGIIVPDPRIDALAKTGGRTVNMPFWQELTGDSEVLSDGGSLTPAKITASQDIAHILYRGKAFSSNDLADAVSGADPMGAIANQVADFWAKDNQSVLTNALKGVFATALASTHVNSVAIEAGNSATAENKFSDSAFLDTCFLLGDAQDEFTAMVCHSVVARRMLDLNLAKEEKVAGAEKAIVTYRGRRVIVDDNTLKVAGSTNGYKYYTFIFGPGAVGYGEGNAKKPVEFDRDSLAGDDILINRRHYILHPRGVKWAGSPAGSSPTNAELATGASWSKVWADKHIRIAALVTNG